MNVAHTAEGWMYVLSRVFMTITQYTTRITKGKDFENMLVNVC